MDAKPIKIFPYSYSSLSSFETCGRKHYGERLSKEFASPFSQAAQDGTDFHKEAEDYINEGKPMTNPYAARIEQVVKELLNAEWELMPEAELAMTKERTPCGFWDKECYVRAKIDVFAINKDQTAAGVLDWKTGKSNPYTTQLKLNAMLIFAKYPTVDRVYTRYEWLKEGFATKATIHREFFEQDWANFEKRVAAYRSAFEKNQWYAKSSGLCKRYCGVITCEHNGNYGKEA